MMFRSPRQHNEKRLAFIRTLPCCICQDDTSTEAAHVRFQDRRAAKRQVGLQEKPDDVWTVPLCGKHHREQHTMNEREFWARYQKDPVFICLALERVIGDPTSAHQIIGAA